MRRSFQDLARTAEVRDVVTRSISGHATEQMQRLYSTVSDREQAESLTRILTLMPPPVSDGASSAFGRFAMRILAQQTPARRQ